MGTPFSDIYHAAASKFVDYDFLRLSDRAKEQIMHAYMISAEKDFAPHCLVDLSRDENNESYIETLDSEIIEILACGIAFYWLSARVLNTENLRNKISSKDISYYSPANLLREMISLRDAAGKEFREKIVRYSYDHGDIAGLRVRDS